MQQTSCQVLAVQSVAENTFLLVLHAPSIAPHVKPGQFLNVRVEESLDPLLRRPFSVYQTDGDRLELLFNVVGKGTRILSQKRKGEMLDVLGPLGVPFKLDDERFSTGILVAGGLGVAPMPLTTRELVRQGKDVRTFLGARTKGALVTTHLVNVAIATDDGSAGVRGTVVDLLEKAWSSGPFVKPKIFACGPHSMLKATAALAERLDIPCEVSLEGPMGCGVGICQGCPVELNDPAKKYALMCKDGPTFDARAIRW
jgi:dihydroorotate dehydrogenase electron transfer subunit